MTAASLLLFIGAAVVFGKSRTLPICLQLLGASGFLVLSGFDLLLELNLISGTSLERKGSAEEIVCLLAAVLSVTCFPVGYFCQVYSGQKRADDVGGS